MALPFGPLGHFFLTSDSCHPRFFILTDLKTTSVFRPVCCRLHCFVVSHPTTGWLPSRPCFHKKQSSWRDTFPSFHHFPLDVSTHTYDVYNPVSQTFVGFFFGCRWTTKQPWCALPIPLCGMLAAVVPSGHHATGSCWKHAPVMLPLTEVPKERRLSVWREPEKSEGTEENLWVAGRFGASPKNGLRPVRGRAFKSNITNFEASAMRAGKQGSNSAQVMLPQNDWYASS